MDKRTDYEEPTHEAKLGMKALANQALNKAFGGMSPSG
jgi:hypothetical protein